MNKEYFIAKKIHQGKSEDKKVSQPIVRIAKVSVILAVMVNIITIAVVTGFQNQVKEKIIAFGSHATIVKAGEFSSFESAPIEHDPQLVKNVLAIDEVKNIQRFAYKPALIQSNPDTVWYTLADIDTFQIQQEIQGVIMKGVGVDFNWSFFDQHIVEGTRPEINEYEVSDQILISSKIARDLNISVGDRVSIFFVKSQPIKDRFTVSGIYSSGLEEFDKQMILGDIQKVQHLNDWGIKSAIRVADTVTKDNQLIIYADVIGGNGNYRYDWGSGYENIRGFTYCDVKDTVFQLIASDYWMFIDEKEEDTAIPDTAYLKVSVSGNRFLPCEPKELENGKLVREFLNDDGTKFNLHFKGGKTITFEYIDGPGSSSNYVGGYEVLVHDFNSLEQALYSLRKSVIYNENNRGDYRVRSIVDEQNEIFVWLSFLDLNVIIILVLMILVSTINMGSGLLVLIITKTSFIGLLKSFGATNWTIRKVFLYQAGFIIFSGMIWGNILGLGFCFLQQHYNLIPLNPEVYYLSAVPIEINVAHVLLLNFGTLILCTAFLIIPSYVITKIAPVKAIKFD